MTAIFTLFFMSGPRASRESSLYSPRMSSSILVLLVEGEPERRAVLKSALENEHVRVLAPVMSGASTGTFLVTPRLIVVSLLGDSRPGLEFLKTQSESAERDPACVLALHDAEDSGAAESALRAGAEDTLSWPTSSAILRARLRLLSNVSLLRAEAAEVSHLLVRLVDVHEQRDLPAPGHSERVASLALAVAAQVGMTASEADRIAHAAQIHDIGFFAISDRVFFKPEPLSREETAQIRSHPVIGSELLRGVPSLEPLRPLVHRHHERLDGSGYPDGLSGREISLSVQILSLADAYEGMTTVRPYRPAFQPSAARDTLWSEARRGLWDPDLVDLLGKALDATFALRIDRS
jgi:putative two-component system response regulator